MTGAGWVWMSTATGVKKLRDAQWPLPEGIKDGDVVTWWEFAPNDMPIEQQVKAVKEIDGNFKPVFTAIDPTDARQQTGQGLKTVKELLEDMDAGAVRKAPNDEDTFILKVQQIFTSRSHYVTENCQRLIREIQSEEYDQARAVPKRKHSHRFHVLAAWKYGVLMEPELLVAGPVLARVPQFPSKSKTGY